MFDDVNKGDILDNLRVNSLLYRRVIRILVNHYAEPLDLNIIASRVRASKFFICREFKKECGLSPMKWLWMFRTLLSLELIKIVPDWSLTDVAFTCGFTSCAHYSRSFKKIVGITPSRFKRNRDCIMEIIELEKKNRNDVTSKAIEDGKSVVSQIVKLASERFSRV